MGSVVLLMLFMLIEIKK